MRLAQPLILGDDAPGVGVDLHLMISVVLDAGANMVAAEPEVRCRRFD